MPCAFVTRDACSEARVCADWIAGRYSMREAGEHVFMKGLTSIYTMGWYDEIGSLRIYDEYMWFACAHCCMFTQCS